MVRPVHAEQLRPGKVAAGVSPDNAATILLGLAIIQMAQMGRTKEGGRASLPLPPWFPMVFVALCITNTIWVVPGIVIAMAGDLSSFFLLAAMTAPGFKTSWRSLSAAGVVPIVIMVAGSLLILALSLLMVMQ